MNMEFFPWHSILWTKLRHLLWMQEFAGFCCINLIKLWTFLFPIVSYSVCSWVGAGQKEKICMRLESTTKAKLLFSEICVVRHRNGQMKKWLVGLNSPPFDIQPVFSTVTSTSHPHISPQWNTEATSHVSVRQWCSHFSSRMCLPCRFPYKPICSVTLVYQADRLGTPPQSYLADLYFPLPQQLCIL